MRQFLWAWTALALIWSVPAFTAGPPVLEWPVDCRLGEDCWIVHHVDTDPGPQGQDFRCGALTYNDHKGTDIAVRIKAAMDRGEECGNGVLVQHDSGWSTQYCHLKSGSVRVATGQTVAAGDLLGEVGNSGAASFPHLHLSVRRSKEVIDPFTGFAMGQGCKAIAAGSLWSGDVQAFLPERDAPLLFGAGFRAHAPRYDALLQDMRSPSTLEAEGPGLVLWAVIVGARKGDILTLEITDPAGQSFIAERFEQEKTQIRRMRFAGRSNRNGILRPGTYQGLVQVLRPAVDGQPPFTIERRVSVDLVE